MTASVSRSWSVALSGVSGHLVEIEADVGSGLPGMTVVGLPDAAVVEARDRIKAAVLNSGEAWPARRVTVSLSPASLRKHGSGFDLALAVAVLAGSGALPRGALEGAVLLGEVALDGCVRPVRGVLPAVIVAAGTGVRRVYVPAPNREEAAAVPGVEAIGVRSLRETLALLRRGPEGSPDADAWECRAHAGDVGGGPRGGAGPDALARPVPGDLADVAGQPDGRRAVEVAAAGGHHVLLLGPPGAGKTMLASRLPSVLPDLTDPEALEVTAVHSVAGLLEPGSGLVRRPPFQDPHHTATVASLVGGGSGVISPGCVSLAHRGVLLLDEAPEFAPAALDALRQPLETGDLVVVRAGAQARFPARFQLVLTANPCPCARPTGDTECRCSPTVRRRYLTRLSGPLLDRVDLRVVVPPITRSAMYDDLERVEPSHVVARRVAAARSAAAERWRPFGFRLNSEVPGPLLRGDVRPPRSALRPLDHALDRGVMSARGYDRVLRIAWTLCDLDGTPSPRRASVEQALALRQEVAA